MMGKLLHLLALWCLSCLPPAAASAAGSSVPSPLRRSQPGNVDDVSREEGTTVSSSSGFHNDDGWRRSLPPGLRDERGAPLHRVNVEGATLYLLGSSHVSRTSCDDARLLMQHVRPDVLFVELCSQRVGLLLSPPASTSEGEEQTGRNKDRTEMTPLSHKGSVLFTKIQADYAKKLNVTIGGEFREAFQSALKQQRRFWGSRRSHPSGILDPYLESEHSPHPRGDRPCAIVLGDRPVRITLLRAWESLRLFGKLKLMIALLWSSIRQPSERELREWMDSILNDRSGKNDLLTKAMEELGRSFPSLKRVIIDERDEFMAAKLRQTAEMLMHEPDHDGEKVIVAVVGAGHCPGMLDRLTQKDDASSTGDGAPSASGSAVNSRPEIILPDLVETRRKACDDEELSSLATDVVQFDYSYALQNSMI